MKRVLLLIALAVWTASPARPASGTGEHATVTYLKGMARLQPASGQISILTLGRIISQGDSVLTLDNAKVELKLDNGTAIRLGPSTNFTLATLQRTPLGGMKSLFKVATGRMWFTVAKLTGDSEMKTETPSVVCAVKGTVWRADTGADGKTNVVVYDGVVTAQQGSGAAVEIQKMEQLAAMPNAAFEKGSYDESNDDKDEWAKWNKNRDKLRIMIILPETHGTEKAMASVSENAAMRRFLNNYLFKVVEKDQVDKIRESEKIKAAVKGDAAAAAAAGLEVGADLIVVGEAKAKYFTNAAMGGLISGVANLTARAVRADTAEVIAADPAISSRAVDITDEAAASKALTMAGEKMASEFVDSILSKWKREMKKGTGLDVVVDGVDYKKLKLITNKLAELNGVKDVQSLYLVGRRSLLNVTCVGDSTSLADEIEKADFSPLKVSVDGLSAYKLEMEVTGGGPLAKEPAPAAPGAAPVTPAPAASSTGQ